jgi:hypothetical protein
MTEFVRRHRPGYTVNALVSIAVRALPKGEQPRYDTEWRSDLYYRLFRFEGVAPGALVLG